jgi:hypothetical protein
MMVEGPFLEDEAVQLVEACLQGYKEKRR